jgi:hypothetical protein
MAKYKVLKTQFTNNQGIPEMIRNHVWVAKIDDNDKMDIFDFYAEAKDFADRLKVTNPERNYKIVEISGAVDVQMVYDEKGNIYSIKNL